MEVLAVRLRPHQSLRRHVVPIALIVLGMGQVAQAVPATALRAAFLYNFAVFTEWPADALAPGQKLSLCVVGDDDVAAALVQTIRGRSLDGHVLTVAIVKPDGILPLCHLLYVGGGAAKRTSQLIHVLAGVAVLLVGETDRFAESGGVVQLVLENDKMRFVVNMGAAQRAGLHLSLAAIVKGTADVRP